MSTRQFFKRALSGLALAALAWSTATGGVGASSAPVDPVAPGEVILKLNDAADLPAIAAQYALDPTPLDQLSVAPLYLMRIVDGVPPDIRALALAADLRVAYAESNVIGAAAEDQGDSSWAAGDSSWAAGGGAALYLGQWAPTVMRLPQAFAVTRGAGVTVAVLDTGVEATHPALARHLVSGYDFVDNDADPSEVGVAGLNRAYGHGTFVAGLVGLAAPEATIMPVRVLDPNGMSDVWRLSKAIVWAANHGAAVINLSLGTSTRTHVASSLIEAVASSGPGVVVVAAAGNGGSNLPMFPAGEGGSRVLSVGASTPLDTLALFSNYGSWVRVAAPGVSLWSSVPGGQYATWSGTSMATGLVSGTAALVRASYPTLNAQNVIGRIASTSTTIGGGVPLRINAGAAVGP